MIVRMLYTPHRFLTRMGVRLPALRAKPAGATNARAARSVSDANSRAAARAPLIADEPPVSFPRG